ncbi:hypothetical protein ACFE04_001319 [Oxalis oulophora]
MLLKIRALQHEIKAAILNGEVDASTSNLILFCIKDPEFFHLKKDAPREGVEYAKPDNHKGIDDVQAMDMCNNIERGATPQVLWLCTFLDHKSDITDSWSQLMLQLNDVYDPEKEARRFISLFTEDDSYPSSRKR